MGHAVYAQYQICGQVLDYGSGLPMAGVNILICQDNIDTITNEQGNYRIIDITDPENIVQFHIEGYHSEFRKVSFDKGDSILFDINAILNPVTVRPEELTFFYQ
jgi:hypothetical protein